MNKGYRIAGLLGLTAVLGLIGYQVLRPSHVEGNSTADVADILKTMTVEVVTEHAIGQHISVEARIAVDANQSTPIYSSLSGPIVGNPANVGDRVVAGQVLASVDSPEFAQLVSDLRTATQTAEQAKATLIRKRSLHESGGASTADLDQAKTDETNAEAALLAARQRAEVLGLSMNEIDVLMSKSPPHAYASIKAPLSGVITDRQFGNHQYIQPGTAVYTVADLSRVWVIGEVSEADSAKVKVGQAVAIEVSASDGDVVNGTLQVVNSVLDPITHRLMVRASVANPHELLKPDMLARMNILVKPTLPQLAIPESAVLYEGNQAFVWVVKDPHHVALKPVTVGSSENGWVPVNSGLSAGERIVTRGGLFIDRSYGVND